MKKVYLVFVITTLCAGYAFAQNNTTVLSVLSKKAPRVKWNAKSQIKGDFDYDGIDDYALRGTRGKFFVLGIVKGHINNKSKSWTLEFEDEDATQGSLCSVSKARISVSDIDNDYKEFAKEYLEDDYAKRIAALPKGSKGINIYDGMCDSFNIFWDTKLKGFTWWRI